MGFDVGQRSARVRLGNEGDRLAPGRRASRQGTQLLLCGGQAGLGLCQDRLRTRHGAVGLVLIGAGQIARLGPLGDVGSNAAAVVELVAGGSGFEAGALPLPSGLANHCRKPQLRGAGAAFDGGAFGRSQRCLAVALAGQPERHDNTDLEFPGTRVAVQAIGLVKEFQRRRFRGPGLGRPLLAARDASRRACRAMASGWRAQAAS